MNSKRTLASMLTASGLMLALSTNAQTANVQIVHNSADEATAFVDVYVNSELAALNFGFREATPFIEVAAGVPLPVGIAPPNSIGPQDIIPDLSYEFTLEEGGNYIIVANGILSEDGYSPMEPFDLYVVPGALQTSPAGTTGVLVFHGATDAPAVDVYESAVLEGNAVENLAYGEQAGYLFLDTEDYILEVRAAGDPNTVAAFQAPLATLGLDGTSLMVMASGFLDPGNNSDGEAFGLFAVLPDGNVVELPAVGQPVNARVQVIHNSADDIASMVDVYLDDELLLEDFAFRTASPFIDVIAGVDITVGIAPAGSTGPEDIIPGLSYTYNLEADETYVLVANGIVVPEGYDPVQPFDIYVFGEGQESSEAGTTGVLVFHGATDAPSVDVFESAVLGVNAVDDLPYGAFAGYLALPTDDYVLEVRAAGDPNTIAAYEAPLSTLGLDGTSMVVMASGFLDPSINNDGPAFGLFAVLPNGTVVELPLVEQSNTARVQVIHNSADDAAASVDVYLNDDLLLNDFAFRTASPFIDAPAGVDITVGIAAAGSTGPEDIIPGLSYTYNLDAGETYVLVANGIVVPDGYDPVQPFDIYVFGQGQESSADGTTGVLVFHGATDAPAVDVFESAVLNANAVEDIAYGEFAGYLDLPTADYVLEVRAAGDPNTIAAYEAPLATLGLDGTSITVVASGFLDPGNNNDGPAFGLWVALPTGGALVELPLVMVPTEFARVQVIHNSADAAAAEVDVYLDNTLLLDDFAFRTASPFINAPAGMDITIGIAPANSTGPQDIIPGLTFEYNLMEDETYVLVANGIVSDMGYVPNIPFDILVRANAREEATVGTNTDLLVVHGATDAPTVQVAEIAQLGGALLVQNLSYGDFAGYLSPPTSDYVLQVQTTDGTPVASYQAPLESLGLEGTALTVLASGFLDPSVNSNGPGFGLWVALPTGGDLVELPLFTSVNELDGIIADMRAWPNPANDQLFIDMDLKEMMQASVQLTDMTGRPVRALEGLSLASGESRLVMDVNGISSGMYLLNIVGSGQVRSLPVQIMR